MIPFRRFHRMFVHFGFMEDPDLLGPLGQAPASGRTIDSASTTFFLGKETILPSEDRPGMALWREKLFSVHVEQLAQRHGVFQAAGRTGRGNSGSSEDLMGCVIES